MISIGSDRKEKKWMKRSMRRDGMANKFLWMNEVNCDCMNLVEPFQQVDIHKKFTFFVFTFGTKKNFEILSAWERIATISGELQTVLKKIIFGFILGGAKNENNKNCTKLVEDNVLLK